MIHTSDLQLAAFHSESYKLVATHHKQIINNMHKKRNSCNFFVHFLQSVSVRPRCNSNIKKYLAIKSLILQAKINCCNETQPRYSNNIVHAIKRTVSYQIYKQMPFYSYLNLITS